MGSKYWLRFSKILPSFFLLHIISRPRYLMRNNGSQHYYADYERGPGRFSQREMKEKPDRGVTIEGMRPAVRQIQLLNEEKKLSLHQRSGLGGRFTGRTILTFLWVTSCGKSFILIKNTVYNITSICLDSWYEFRYRELTRRAGNSLLRPV